MGLRRTVAAALVLCVISCEDDTAPGCVADQACKEGHESIYDSYQSVGMARSFYRLTKDTAVEPFGFGASAWKVAPRDQFIGWTAEERVDELALVVNNARFLLLPWIESRNLASRLLSRVAKQLPEDWESRYGYRPVLLETFVEVERFRGTCYRAANWIHVGKTQGRGELDRWKRRELPVKHIFLYPLCREFRQRLRGHE